MSMQQFLQVTPCLQRRPGPADESGHPGYVYPLRVPSIPTLMEESRAPGSEKINGIWHEPRRPSPSGAMKPGKWVAGSTTRTFRSRYSPAVHKLQPPHHFLPHERATPQLLTCTERGFPLYPPLAHLFYVREPARGQTGQTTTLPAPATSRTGANR